MNFRTPAGSDADRLIFKSRVASGRRVSSTGDLALPTVAPADAAMGQAADVFWQRYAGEALTHVVRRENHYDLTFDTVCCRVGAAALAAAMATRTPVWGPLKCSFMVAEAAWDAGLPDAAVQGILGAFRTGMRLTGSPEQAMLDVQPKLALAVVVERYVGRPEGLVHDQARIAHFTPEALSGRTGNRLVQRMQGDPAKQRELVSAYRLTLENSLDDAVQAVREARNSGDYGVAVDLLRRFFRVGFDITAAVEWQDRLHGFAPPDRRTAG
jgi:hypothetical protein